jgi:Tfp pilus assembly protein FimT
VVVVITSIIVAVTVPRFSSTFSRVTLGGTARGLAGAMVYLRNAASKENRSYFLTIDFDEQKYGVQVIAEKAEEDETPYMSYAEPDMLDDGFYTKYSDAFVSETRLQKKIVFERATLEDGTPVFEGALRIEFRPDGTADEVVIYLMDPKERVYSVYLEGYNGQPRVYKYPFVPEPPPELIERERSRDERETL